MSRKAGQRSSKQLKIDLFQNNASFILNLNVPLTRPSLQKTLRRPGSPVRRFYGELDTRHQLFATIPDMVDFYRFFCPEDPGKIIKLAILSREGFNLVNRLPVKNSCGHHSINTVNCQQRSCPKKHQDNACRHEISQHVIFSFAQNGECVKLFKETARSTTIERHKVTVKPFI